MYKLQNSCKFFFKVAFIFNFKKYKMYFTILAFMKIYNNSLHILYGFTYF